ncbi:MAG: hypothetical protein OXI81_03480 [Paracoccaceae bacterium]|nr:hypothetical protein [Paracoccaceae bacterium]MDE2914955.1 hypothetical protein [Paracoccaceae bacterium]
MSVQNHDNRKRQEPFARFLSAVAIATLGLSSASGVAFAEDGTFRLIQSLVRDFTTFEHAGDVVTGGALDGTSTILESTGDPFVEGAVSKVTCVTLVRASEAGIDLEAPCTMTDGEGDHMYVLAKRRSGTIEGGGGGDGRYEILGGTGKFADVRGNCPYDTEYLNDSLHIVTRTECAWHRVSQ